MRAIGLLLTLVLLAGCASASLTHTPAVNPTNVPVSVNHRLTSNRFYVEVASGGFRVESVVLRLADGNELTAESIHHPAAGRSRTGGGISLGVGSRGVIVGNTAIGGGVGIGGGPTETYGNTVAIFPGGKVGEGPWTLTVKLLSMAPVEIELPGLGAAEG